MAWMDSGIISNVAASRHLFLLRWFYFHLTTSNLIDSISQSFGFVVAFKMNRPPSIGEEGVGLK